MVASLAADIIMDVARAANPVRFKVAVNKLENGADPARVAGDVALAFSAIDEQSGVLEKPANGVHLPFDVEMARLRLGGRDGVESALTPFNRLDRDDVYQKFEAMTLQQFVQALLPKESQSWFGKGFTGDMWKSLLAQQIAGELARSGGIGIAQAVEKAHPSETAEPDLWSAA